MQRLLNRLLKCFTRTRGFLLTMFDFYVILWHLELSGSF